MAYDGQRAVQPPAHDVVMDSVDPRLHWWDRAGGSWTPDAALPLTISGLVVHWREANTPGGLSARGALLQAASDAHYHAFDRDWDLEMPGVQGADGIQYHWYICDGHLLQVSPETKRLWHASRANSWSISVCLAAGHGDPLRPENVATLLAFLDWCAYGRPDLPLLTATPQRVTVRGHNGLPVVVQTHGILTHDEARALEGLPPKGCCGLYKDTVTGWRARQVGGKV